VFQARDDELAKSGQPAGYRQGRRPEGFMPADKIKCRGTQGRLRPHACIVDMDLNDIDAAFLYLSIDLF
jgi:hypothetical protein